MSDETRALAVRPLTSDVWRMIETVAPAIYRSRLFGVNNIEQAQSIMLKGFELGLPLAASFEFVSVVMGKPTLSPRGALALVMQSGLLEGMKIDDGDGFCTVWMKRKNGPEYTLTYGYQDAKRAGLVKPDSNWDKYGPNMCRWRSIGFVIDVLFSDVCGGLKRADEFGAEIDQDGHVVNAEWSQVAPASTTPPVPPLEQPDPTISAITLDQLLEAFGGEAVIVANEGKIPGTQEEVAAIARKLAGVPSA